MKKTEVELKKIIRGFRAGLLNKEKSEGMCFAVSCALAGYLKFLGYDCVVTEGMVEDWEHFWITLPDGTIVDATADQFNKKYGKSMPAVYIGPKLDYYIVEANP